MKTLVRLAIVSCLLVLSGCALFYDQKVTHNKSSVVDYLYPKQAKMTVKPTIPRLNLPIKVGIAFVPAKHSHRQTITASEKTDLLENVAKHFKKYPYVSDIEVIPSDYLTRGGSFTNLDQIKSMYGVDVIALVSYDQVQFTDSDFLSLSYWTLVGAYVVSGEKNDTNTMLDTAVFDIASRSMLFRAPGTSEVKGRSTPVSLDQELRADSKKGFELAADKMIVNLDNQLKRFEQDVKRSPKKAIVKARQGYEGTAAGGGSFGMWALLMLGMLWISQRYMRKSQQKSTRDSC